MEEIDNAKTIGILKEIYAKTSLTLDYLQFAPKLDKVKWEKALNSLVPTEEPLSVLCIGGATAKKILSILSASKFLFSTSKLYLEKTDGIKYTDIASISYKEEMKDTLFGFGKPKSEGYLVINCENGQSISLKGNYATESIAEFLNKAVNELKKNPPEILPKTDSSQTDRVANKIKERFKDNLNEWIFRPNIKHEDINSAIILENLNERYSSCAACYTGFKKNLYFLNETLVSENHVAIRYKDIVNIKYEQNYSEINIPMKSLNRTADLCGLGQHADDISFQKTNRVILIYGANNSLLLSIKTDNDSTQTANALNHIISEISKTDEELRKEAEDKRMEKEKWILENKEKYITFQNDEDKKLFFDLIDKWNIIFQKKWELDTYDKDKNTALYRCDKSGLELQTSFHNENQSESIDDYTNIEKDFKYFPDIESDCDKCLRFYSKREHNTFILEMKSKSISQEFKSNDKLLCSDSSFSVNLKDACNLIFQKTELYENMITCIQNLRGKVNEEMQRLKQEELEKKRRLEEEEFERKQKLEQEKLERKRKQEQEELERKRKLEQEKLEQTQKARNDLADW